MGIIWLVMLAILIVVIAGLWKIFTKAGKPGWAAIVPIYNVYILIEIVGRPTWWLALLLLGLIPGLGGLLILAVMFVLYWDLAKSFGKEIGFAIGMTLLGVIFIPMLGFGDAQYLGPRASGFGLPDQPAGGGYAGGGGYAPPAPGGYNPPASGGYTPPAPPSYAPPAPPSAPPAAPTYAPPAPPAAPPAAPTYEPPTAPPPAPPV
jgi:hypothetical protein